jgi:uroporphyrinogen decarboxylase
MNSYERTMSVLGGRKPDLLPVLPMVREWCSTQAGFDFIEEMENVEKHVFAQSYCVKEFGYDVVWDMFAVHAESEAMGSKLKIVRGVPPSVIEPAIAEYDTDLPRLKLVDPYQNNRLSTILEGIRQLKRRFHGDVPVMGYIQAPFRHVCMLRGPEHAMKDMFKNKEKLRELCELALYSQVVYGLAVISAGADILFVSDPTSSGDAISKKHWEAWGLGLTTRLVSVLKRSGVKILMHICGDTSDRLESLASTGVDGLSLDEKVDFELARKRLGPDYCLMGNVSTTLLALGQPEAVAEATREVIAKAGKDGRLIVSGGCQLADICPPENITAMVKAAREYRL